MGIVDVLRTGFRVVYRNTVKYIYISQNSFVGFVNLKIHNNSTTENSYIVVSCT